MTSPSSVRKGLLLAGGRGQRLAPMTFAVNKHLLPVDGVPMIYYPLTLLMELGFREIGVVIDPRDREPFERLLGDGSELGLVLEWIEQDQPRGLADGLRVAEAFLDSRGCLVVLGDTLLLGSEARGCLQRLLGGQQGAGILAIPSAHPRRFGVVELDACGAVRSLAEKPRDPRSNLVMPGVYVLDGRAAAVAGTLKPSERGELEMVDVLWDYQVRGELTCESLSDREAWFDLGTSASLARATRLVRGIRRSSGRLVACPEEWAFRRGDLTGEALLARADRHPNCYGRYLRSLV